jgi:hypothetical protein
MLLATRHLSIRSGQEPPDTAGPPPPEESEGAGEVGVAEDGAEGTGAGADCGTEAGLCRPRSPGFATAGSAGSDWDAGAAVAELERGVVLAERPCATWATNTAKPAVSAALEPITQRRM